jgi:hypothetical protein
MQYGKSLFCAPPCHCLLMQSESPEKPPPKDAIDKPWMVLLVLFGVTGCLGIPLLFMSRGFTNTSRILWSLVSILYTALLLWGFVLIMQWCWGRLEPVFMSP